VATSLPVRKTLPHGRPFFPESPFFITIHATARERNVLATPNLAPRLWEEWLAYANLGRCFPALFLVMPDHVHGLFTFPQSEIMQNVISAWKRLTALRYGVSWQRDFFDHRIRNDEERLKKADYILTNPVRKGLVETPEAWPYVWRAES
jgi:putative transposase